MEQMWLGRAQVGKEKGSGCGNEHGGRVSSERLKSKHSRHTKMNQSKQSTASSPQVRVGGLDLARLGSDGPM